MQGQSLIHTFYETVAEAGLADFEHRLEMLRPRLELADFGVGQCLHFVLFVIGNLFQAASSRVCPRIWLCRRAIRYGIIACFG